MNNTYDTVRVVFRSDRCINRMLFAIKYQEPNIMLSNLINDQSRIMWDRDPRTIVGKVALWLWVGQRPVFSRRRWAHQVDR